MRIENFITVDIKYYFDGLKIKILLSYFFKFTKRSNII